ncbi:hypothetical protein [Microbispora siamensis]|uniref:hypothetical protein n=1 Tax=Microbispora siamensis TaxID=564413 RepID=UPI00194EC47A|nr:hypothetical protein [Microbispora siamensis]
MLAGDSTRELREILLELDADDEKRLVRLSGGELALAVSSQTNIAVDLREPMEVPRPRRPWTAVRPAATVRRVRFFAGDPAAALRAVVALTTTTAGERAP